MIIAASITPLIVMGLIFLFFGWLSNQINKLKAGAEKNRRIRKKGKITQTETAEDFFAKIEAQKREQARIDQAQEAQRAHAAQHQKLRLKPEHQKPKREALAAPLISEEPMFTEFHEIKPAKQAKVHSNKRKKKNIVDLKNQETLKNAIIIGEILAKPKAYDM